MNQKHEQHLARYGDPNLRPSEKEKLRKQLKAWGILPKEEVKVEVPKEILDEKIEDKKEIKVEEKNKFNVKKKKDVI